MLSLTVVHVAAAADFAIVRENRAVPVVYDAEDAEVVGVCVAALATDIEQITGVMPALQSEVADASTAIVAGTLGHSRWIDKWAGAGTLAVDDIKGKWESFTLQIVENPEKGLDRALVIAGSDPRGTAFGIFELSKRLGVSPWVWWADARRERRETLGVQIDTVVMGPPSVKYRGIFLNDEDWGLHPWAAKNLDTDIKDIGPKTYARIFELLLRLKANYIWPAMHPCTKAFFYYDENPDMAARYSIVLGSTHCEPMLRNNVDEWKNNFPEEYNESQGPWRYDLNKRKIYRYWKDRAQEAADIDAVYTVGMRGIHDSGMPGGKSQADKIELLEQVIRDQREILRESVNPDVTQVPQIFCPYKEVLYLYDAGLDVPEDITIVWPDDNHGYIRRLATPEEQRRSGGFGVYYHLSYWGGPADYLWLSSISPALISFEMSKAYAYGADRLWVFNVGDIKPAELETEFAMDLAWDAEAWPPHKALEYLRPWAARTFGEAVADDIAAIQAEYYRLAASGKPEHMDRVVKTLSDAEKEQRLEDYAALSRKAQALKQAIPERLQDAYFQLILYPVLGAANMSKKHIYADKSYLPAGAGDPRTADHGKRAMEAYETIKRLTQTYNREISDGKWNGMMSMNPRNRSVFRKPEVAAGNVIALAPADSDLKPPTLGSEENRVRIIPAEQMAVRHPDLQLIPGLGVSGAALTRSDFTGASFEAEDADKAPVATVEVTSEHGVRKIVVDCVPAHAIHEGRGLRVAVSVNGVEPRILNFKKTQWHRNVIRGYDALSYECRIEGGETATLRIALLDPGLAVSRVRVY